MTEALTPPITQETDKLVERIGKNKMRAIAALGIAAAGLFGSASGKINAGAGVPVAAWVDVESVESKGWQQLGIAGKIGERARDASGVVTVVQIGGVSVRVGYTELAKGDGVVLLAVHPAADTSNAYSQREAVTREMSAKK